MGMSFSMSGTTSPRSLMMPGWFVIGKLYDIGSFRLSALFLNTDVEWLLISTVDSPMGATITSAISKYFTSHYVLRTFSRVNTLFQRIRYLKWWFISSWWFTRQHPGARGISKRCLFAMIFLLQEWKRARVTERTQAMITMAMAPGWQQRHPLILFTGLMFIQSISVCIHIYIYISLYALHIGCFSPSCIIHIYM